eukprot:CAMPEP_0174367004 /NCGR_PEP_ID=MMETSP0811_2-20130205/83403_1 /TAXON_ID=73025 ORGANISM="Eutreptiella gymnastica-like, Strain CCMP1594" /NCGR_SAMPLE_ID=MMETSP0811_2 /ASSEMBLY_ACC=CAM_ASM_000667 /LENGTH=134 /DNA_ID=CAMNT_0015509107 /DNA_START=751 /DNA_END=1152 /DNA_ORIENTATION=-
MGMASTQPAICSPSMAASYGPLTSSSANAHEWFGPIPQYHGRRKGRTQIRSAGHVEAPWPDPGTAQKTIMRFAPSTDAATAANIPRLQESQSEMHAQSVHSPVPWSCSTVDLGSTATKLIQADMWGGWAGLLVL